MSNTSIKIPFWKQLLIFVCWLLFVFSSLLLIIYWKDINILFSWFLLVLFSAGPSEISALLWWLWDALEKGRLEEWDIIEISRILIAVSLVSFIMLIILLKYKKNIYNFLIFGFLVIYLLFFLGLIWIFLTELSFNLIFLISTIIPLLILIPLFIWYMKNKPINTIFWNISVFLLLAVGVVVWFLFEREYWIVLLSNYITIFFFYIILQWIIQYKILQSKDQEEIDQKFLTSGNRFKWLFVISGILIITFFVMFVYFNRGVSVELKEIEEDFFQVQWYNNDLDDEDNWIIVVKEFLEEYNENIPEELQNSRYAPEWIHQVNSYFWEDKGFDRDKYLDKDLEYYEDPKYQRLVEQWLENHEDVFRDYYESEFFHKSTIKLNNILKSYEFQYPMDFDFIEATKMLSPYLHTKMRNISWMARYSCHIGDYERCFIYLETLDNFVNNYFYDSNWILTHTTSWITARWLYLSSLTVILENYDIPEAMKKELRKKTKNNLSNTQPDKINDNALKYEYITKVRNFFGNYLEPLDKGRYNRFFDYQETFNFFQNYFYHKLNENTEKIDKFNEVIANDREDCLKFRKNIFWCKLIFDFTFALSPIYEGIQENLEQEEKVLELLR